VLDNGRGIIDELHVLALGAGEFCWTTSKSAKTTARIWWPMERLKAAPAAVRPWKSRPVAPWLSGSGFGSAYCFHVRATSGGDNGANRVETDLTAAMTAGNTATIRGRARWLRGHPDVLLRLHGNHLEAVGSLPVPRNLGTPGTANSQYHPNAGPAIHDVRHSPVLPAADRPSSSPPGE